MTIEQYKNHINSCVWSNCGLKIAHAYAQFYNFGDNALAYGVQNLFQKYFAYNSRFIIYDVHSTIFDKEILSKISNECDLLVVGGGGLIHTSESKYWLFNMDDKDIKFLKKPIIFFGLGYNNFSMPLHYEAIKNIKKLAESYLVFSVRNDGSKERLSEFGLNFMEIPDPGFFVDGNHPRPQINGEYIIIQIAYDSNSDRNVDNNYFYKNMIDICKKIISLNFTIVLTPHCHPDIDISQKIYKDINNERCIMWDWFKIIRHDHTIEGLGYYKHAYCVIAMRGHAQICPIGMITPVISICNHPKHYGILNKIGINDNIFSVTDKNLSENIINSILHLKNDKSTILYKYESIIHKMNNQIENFIFEINSKYQNYKINTKYYTINKQKIHSKLSIKEKISFNIRKYLDTKLR